PRRSGRPARRPSSPRRRSWWSSLCGCAAYTVGPPWRPGDPTPVWWGGSVRRVRVGAVGVGEPVHHAVAVHVGGERLGAAVAVRVREEEVVAAVAVAVAGAEVEPAVAVAVQQRGVADAVVVGVEQ